MWKNVWYAALFVHMRVNIIKRIEQRSSAAARMRRSHKIFPYCPTHLLHFAAVGRGVRVSWRERWTRTLVISVAFYIRLPPRTACAPALLHACRRCCCTPPPYAFFAAVAHRHARRAAYLCARSLCIVCACASAGAHQNNSRLTPAVIFRHAASLRLPLPPRLCASRHPLCAWPSCLFTLPRIARCSDRCALCAGAKPRIYRGSSAQTSASHHALVFFRVAPRYCAYCLSARCAPRIISTIANTFLRALRRQKTLSSGRHQR